MSDNKLTLIGLAKKLIEDFEGFSHTIYKDTKGIDTIGFGRNLQTYPLSDEEKEKCLLNGKNEIWMPLEVAEDFLVKEIEKIIENIKDKEYYKNQDTARKCVLIDMNYNMGISTFNKYKNFQEAMKNKDYEKACYEMEHGTGEGGKSKWYLQTKRRAIKDIEIIRTGDVTLI